MSCYLCNLKELKVGRAVGGEGAGVAKWKSGGEDVMTRGEAGAC